VYPPTFDVASVKLLSVVLFPLEGLPTRPINGSLGILSWHGSVAFQHSTKLELGARKCSC
jgi:hypothetical protein